MASPNVNESSFAETSIDQTSIDHAREQSLEAEDQSDADSALGDDTQSCTTSLSESIYSYRQEFGRTYHAYKDGQYVFPNDERESDRLDLQNHILNLTYRRLHFAPLHDPQYALDVGAGTGIWAMDFADLYPNCQVTGIDLSPGQPAFVPPNLKFVVDDAEDEWIYDHKFDYVHCRLMAGCFADVERFIQQAYEYKTHLSRELKAEADKPRSNLEPGGYLEFQDYGLPLKSSDGSLEGTALQRWGELMCEAARKLGRPMGSEVSYNYRGWMEAAGFVDIEERAFMWPSNPWPRDKYMKELGHWNMINITEGLEGFCLQLLTRGLGWEKQEIDILVAKVANDIKDKKIHAYYPMPVVWGRKPLHA